jgi:hypothetical protein
VIDDDAIFAMRAAFLHDHGVGTGRDRRTGEDAGGSAGLAAWCRRYRPESAG